jgi:hypothetical protein
MSNNKALWKTVKQDQEIVKSWPKWMQQIVITAKTCSTGRFLKCSKEKVK